MHSPEVKIQLAVLGEDKFDLNKMSALTNIVPDKTWRVGDYVSKTKLLHKNSGWILESDTVESWDAGMLAEDFFFGRVLGAAHAISDSQGEVAFDTVELRILITASAGLPALYLSSKLISAIQEIGSAIDIDVIMI